MRLVGVRNVRASSLVLLSVAGFFGAACSLILSKEPLTCSTNADCAKYPGTTCQAGECQVGNASNIVEASTDGSDSTDAPAEETGPVDPCFAANKPLVELKGEITENVTLKCENDYVLRGRVVIKAPYQMNINPGTTVYGDPTVDPTTNAPGTLVVPNNARLIATGERDKPVVFTSLKVRGLADSAYPQDAAPNGAVAADWGGIYIFGDAPVAAAGGTATYVGLEPYSTFGGSNPASDNGELTYVRIEYAGASLTGEDGPGLLLAGVGTNTEINHLEIRLPGDDCIGIQGGTVNLKHVICQYPGDDGIAWELGWTGKVQFMFVQSRPGIDNNSNGLQGRAANTTPISNPTFYNATFIGQRTLPAVSRANQQYGVRLERGTHAHIFNSLMMGWEAALELRGTAIPADVALGDTGGAGGITLKNSLAFGNIVANIAYAETVPTGAETDPFFNDDNGFDEVAWFKQPANMNSEVDPLLPKCFDATFPRCQPATALGAVTGGVGTPTAAVPPNDGFFEAAQYIGCWKDLGDAWAQGRWVRWSEF